MFTHRQTAQILFILLLVAIALAWSLPGDAVARGLFQSPLPPTPLPVFTATPTATVAPAATTVPTEAPTQTAAPPTNTPVAVPTMTVAPGPTVTPQPVLTDALIPDIAPQAATPAIIFETVTPESPGLLPAVPATQTGAPAAPAAESEAGPASGFLPAPTLTAPDALRGESPALLPGPQPPLVAPAAPLVEPDEPENQGLAGVPGVAELIDNGVIALSYVWLCCGGLGLVAAALFLIWLARRGRQVEEPNPTGVSDDDHEASS